MTAETGEDRRRRLIYTLELTAERDWDLLRKIAREPRPVTVVAAAMMMRGDLAESTDDVEYLLSIGLLEKDGDQRVHVPAEVLEAMEGFDR